MLRLLADENFSGDIVRGVLLRHPDIDLVRVQDAGLAGMQDDAILAWAAKNNRVLLTHDRATMPGFASGRVIRGEPMVGVFVLNDRFPAGRAIQEIVLVASCSEQLEWNKQVIYLPI